jgi:hypothetical protein
VGDTGVDDTGVGDTGGDDTGVDPVTVVLSEDFSDDLGFTKLDGAGAAGTFFSAGNYDHWGISDGTTGGDFDGGAAPDITGRYTGLTGNFLVGQDLNHVAGTVLPSTLRWSGLDITGLSDLQVSLKLAEALASDGNNDIDDLDYIRIEAVIDGGAPVLVAELRGDATFNGLFREDTDADLVGDGPVAVGPAAQTFEFDIAGSGTTLDLVLSVSADAGDEDVAVDDVTVSGTP